jgi:6-phosphofructokinase 1
VRKDVLAIVVGGGPAPGINGVISAAAIEAVNEGLKVIGIREGFKSLFTGDRGAAVPLDIEGVSRIHDRGGSVLMTSRFFPEDLAEAFKTMMDTLKALRVRYLLNIGGDGTLYLSSLIEKEAGGAVGVVHVPKSIDNDIPLPGGMPTFGYETARHWGVEIVGNLMEDARTTGRWYVVTTMGRNTGHLALGIGKAAGATITLIPEEFGENVSIRTVARCIEGSIIKRLSMGKPYGVAVLAEGIAGKLGPGELDVYGRPERDGAGRVRLSSIRLGRFLRDIITGSLAGRGIGMKVVDKRVGYELRAADPTPFDAEYTRNLGFGAVRTLLGGGAGCTVTHSEEGLMAVPFGELLDPGTGRTRQRFVDTSSESYLVGSEYMIRLEEKDMKGAGLSKLAETARLGPEEFRDRFSGVLAKK